MSESLKLCVVIPAYNYAHVISHAVLSVVEQLTEQCELLVINDGSTDNTAEVLQGLLEQTKNAFRVIEKANGGLASVRNLGIEESTAEYFIFLDADDRLVKNALNDVLGFIEKNPEVEMLIGGTISVWADHSKTKEYIPSQLPKSALERVRGYLITKQVSLANGATVMHRSVFARGKYPEHFRNAEDIPVFAQVLAYSKCMIIDKPLAYIHKSPTSLRHNVDYDRQVGLQLVDEVFESERLGKEFKILKKLFVSQRALSLFRGYYVAGLYKEARSMYLFAVRNSWRAIFRFSYTRKFLRALFK